MIVKGFIASLKEASGLAESDACGAICRGCGTHCGGFGVGGRPGGKLLILLTASGLAGHVLGSGCNPGGIGGVGCKIVFWSEDRTRSRSQCLKQLLPPACKVNVDALIVEGFIASLKVGDFLLMATPAAPFAGTVELTVAL